MIDQGGNTTENEHYKHEGVLMEMNNINGGGSSRKELHKHLDTMLV